MSQAEFLKRIVDCLEQSDIPYMVVGSLASALHGAPRATQDVDIVIDPTEESLANLVGRLPAKEYYFDADAAHDALDRRAQFNVIDLSTGWKADLIVRKGRDFSIGELRRRYTAHVQGVDVFVASAEDTIISKLEWSAIAESERQLRDVAGIVAVQGEALDRKYIDRWARELGISEIWRRADQMARGEW